jgi:hypothetical protein
MPRRAHQVAVSIPCLARSSSRRRTTADENEEEAGRVGTIRDVAAASRPCSDCQSTFHYWIGCVLGRARILEPHDRWTAVRAHQELALPGQAVPSPVRAHSPVSASRLRAGVRAGHRMCRTTRHRSGGAPGWRTGGLRGTDFAADVVVWTQRSMRGCGVAISLRATVAREGRLLPRAAVQRAMSEHNGTLKKLPT